MNQTPLHENLNGTVLAMMPRNCVKIVDVGCMSGILAREYKKIILNVFI
jgi:ribosomal protein L11 methylase PrmA